MEEENTIVRVREIKTLLESAATISSVWSSNEGIKCFLREENLRCLGGRGDIGRSSLIIERSCCLMSGVGGVMKLRSC